jgi:hypothetical protein
MKTEHTPTPWRRHQCEYDSIVESKTGYAIAMVSGHRFTDQCNEDNLRFILRACNNHERLVDALTELLNYTGGSDITDKSHPIAQAHAILEKLNQ